MADVPLVKESLLTTKGDLFVFDGTDLVRVGVGTDDHVLTADAAQAAGLKWAAGGGSGGSSEYVEIAEVELGSAAASISFSSIPATYKDLVIVGELRSTFTGGNEFVRIRVGNGSVDTGSNYRWHFTGITHAGGAIGSLTEGDTSSRIASSAEAFASDAGVFASVEFRINRYTDTARKRHILSTFTNPGNTTQAASGTSGGVWENTADAIDIVTIFSQSGSNWAAGSYLTLYGRGLA